MVRFNGSSRINHLAAMLLLAAACGAPDGETTGSETTGGEPSTGAASSTGSTSLTGDASGEPSTTDDGSASGSASSDTGVTNSTGGDDSTGSVTTGEPAEPGDPVELGAAASFAILAKSGISTVPDTAITGDLGVSPAAATFITGFSLTADPTNVFATSTQVTGKVYAADYEPPTPSDLTTAVGDMQLAFTDAAGRAPDVSELGAGDIGGMTLSAGVYKWGTGLLIPTDVTLEGSATDVWIFQIAEDLTVGDAAQIALTGGALPENVFWQVSGLVELGTTVHFEGVVLAQTSVTLNTGASINGRLLAQTAVSLGSDTVVDAVP